MSNIGLMIYAIFVRMDSREQYIRYSARSERYRVSAHACSIGLYLIESLMLVDSGCSSSNFGWLKRAAALLSAIRDSHLSSVDVTETMSPKIHQSVAINLRS